MKAQGAVLVDITDFKFEDLSKYGQIILDTDFKEDVKAYLATTPPAVKTRTLSDLIAFNQATPRELLVFGQDRWEAAEKTTGFDDPLYREAVAVSQRTTGPEGIDKLLKDYDVVALIQPTGEPASLHSILPPACAVLAARPRAALLPWPAIPTDRAHGQRQRSARRTVFHRYTLVGADIAVPGLCLRTGHPRAPGARW